MGSPFGSLKTPAWNVLQGPWRAFLTASVRVLDQRRLSARVKPLLRVRRHLYYRLHFLLSQSYNYLSFPLKHGLFEYRSKPSPCLKKPVAGIRTALQQTVVKSVLRSRLQSSCSTRCGCSGVFSKALQRTHEHPHLSHSLSRSPPSRPRPRAPGACDPIPLRVVRPTPGRGRDPRTRPPSPTPHRYGPSPLRPCCPSRP